MAGSARQYILEWCQSGSRARQRGAAERRGGRGWRGFLFNLSLLHNNISTVLSGIVMHCLAYFTLGSLHWAPQRTAAHRSAPHKQTNIQDE